jgi:hypothetical protein
MHSRAYTLQVGDTIYPTRFPCTIARIDGLGGDHLSPAVWCFYDTESKWGRFFTFPYAALIAITQPPSNGNVSRPGALTRQDHQNGQ